MYLSGKTLIVDFGVKRSVVEITGQVGLHLARNLFLGDNSCLNWSVIFNLHYMYHLSPREDPYRFYGQKVSGQGYRFE